MIKKQDLIKLESIVKPLLEDKPITRNDDGILYAEVIRTYYPEYGNTPLFLALSHHNEFDLPNLESVSRCRRKIQAQCPELESDRAKSNRAKQAQEYIAYAKS